MFTKRRKTGKSAGGFVRSRAVDSLGMRDLPGGAAPRQQGLTG
ncbi:MAG TPA: hypothetical protein VFZ40_15285 [Pyrinomonadaceae bacterium]